MDDLLVKTSQENYDQFFIANHIGKPMAEPCNCDDHACSGDKGTHKHENGECIHVDGTKHPIHEKH